MRTRAFIFSTFALCLSGVLAASESRAEICEKFVNAELARYKFGSFDYPRNSNKTRPTSQITKFSHLSWPNHYVMIETVKDDPKVDHVVSNQITNSPEIRQIRMKGCRMVEVIYGTTSSGPAMTLKAETCTNDLNSLEVQTAAKALLADKSFSLTNSTNWLKANDAEAQTLRKALNIHSTVTDGWIKFALATCAKFKDYLPKSAQSNPVFQIPAKEEGVSGTTH